MNYKNWTKVKLKDITKKIGSGATPRGGQRVYVESGISFIRSQNVYNHSFLYEGLAYINEEHASKLKNVIVEEDDILLNITGDSVCRCCIVPKDVLPARVNQHVSIIRADKHKVLPFFLKSYLTSPYMQRYMYSLAKSGGTRAALTKGMIENFEIPLPSIEVQKKIISVLLPLDKKININNEMNNKLEEIAQTIFKHWFIDFEFPNEKNEPFKSSGGKFVESELGMIPENWNVVSGADLFYCYNGYSYKGKELGTSRDAMVTIKNFNRDGSFRVDGLKEIVLSDRVKPHHFVKVGDVVVAHTDLTQSADIIGNPILIYSDANYENLIISMDTVKVTSKYDYISNPFIYLLLKDNRFKNFALGYVNGTTVLHLSKKAINEYKLPLPTDKSILENFVEIINPIFKKVANNYLENESIQKLRDILLPKLMSGEIHIAEAEEVVESCLQKSN